MNKVTVWVVWGALLIAIVVYGVVGLLIDPEEASKVERVAQEEAGSPIAPILTSLAVVLLGISFFVRFVFITRRPDAPFSQLFTIQIVVFVMVESVAFFGLILFLIGEIGKNGFLGFLAAAGIVLLFHAPTWVNSKSLQS